MTGPAIIGANANLGKYSTAQGLLTFISTTMPLDAPGGLSQQEYFQVLCYLLVQNGFTPGNTVFNASNLGSIRLTKGP